MRNLIVILTSLIIFSCSKKTDSPADCAGTSIVVNATSTNSSNTSSSGTITVLQPLSTEYSYKINSGSYQASPVFTNLATGTYTITAKNSAGCTGASIITVGSFDCSATVITVTGTTTQSASNNGSITITMPIGSGYTYSLNGGAFQTGTTFSALAPGMYTVTAKNTNGCTGFEIFDINGCYSINGKTDTGSHKIYANTVYLGSLIPDIRDTLQSSASGQNVVTHSRALNRNLTGIIDIADCNHIIYDSIIFSPGDTLAFQSATLGNVKFWNIRAGGNATISSTGLNTSLKIAKGTSNLSILPSIAGIEFRGVFLHTP